MPQGYIRGRLCDWDEERESWVWSDNKELAEGWGGESRSCPHCEKEVYSDNAPDPCLGLIEGATGGCCGHGVHPGYVSWPGVGAPPGWARRAYIVNES